MLAHKGRILKGLDICDHHYPLISEELGFSHITASASLPDHGRPSSIPGRGGSGI